MATKQPTSSHFTAYRGPMALDTWALQLIREFLWVQEYPYHHQMMTQTHPKAVGKLSEKVNFSQICEYHRTAYRQQFRGFGGIHGPC